MTFPVTINGNTYVQNDVFGPTGFEYVTGLPAIINDVAVVAAEAVTAATTAEQAKQDAIDAIANQVVTSTTANTVADSGTITFTTAEDLDSAIPVPDARYVRCVPTTDQNTWIIGQVNSASGNTLEITAVRAQGSGSFSDWEIFPTGQPGEDGQPDVISATQATIKPSDNILFADADDNDNGRRDTVASLMIQTSIMTEFF